LVIQTSSNSITEANAYSAGMTVDDLAAVQEPTRKNQRFEEAVLLTVAVMTSRLSGGSRAQPQGLRCGL
jgi:hypothetical protein